MGATSLHYFIDEWAKISNKNDGQVIDLLDTPHRLFQESIGKFVNWWRGCNNRIAYIRANLQ